MDKETLINELYKKQQRLIKEDINNKNEYISSLLDYITLLESTIREQNKKLNITDIME